jgi:CRP-like cAMP-binding protein
LYEIAHNEKVFSITRFLIMRCVKLHRCTGRIRYNLPFGKARKNFTPHRALMHCSGDVLMSSMAPASRAEGNWLLAALSNNTYTSVAAACEIVPAMFKEILIEPDVPMKYVYFPLSGCLSVVTVMKNGTSVEVGTVGWEGMCGTSLVNGVTRVPTQCIVQLEGQIKRIELDVFVRLLSEHDELRALMHRYSQAWTDQVGQAGSCNGVHSVEQRCARWLLITHDRVDSNQLPLTQEFLGVMLGVRRASVTVAASALQRAGLINYKRGKIIVLDRAGLEAASCECYRAMRDSYDRLLPIAQPRTESIETTMV